jgi:hypothetical protein
MALIKGIDGAHQSLLNGSIIQHGMFDTVGSRHKMIGFMPNVRPKPVERTTRRPSKLEKLWGRASNVDFAGDGGWDSGVLGTKRRHRFYSRLSSLAGPLILSCPPPGRMTPRRGFLPWGVRIEIRVHAASSISSSRGPCVCAIRRGAENGMLGGPRPGGSAGPFAAGFVAVLTHSWKMRRNSRRRTFDSD